MDKPAYGFPTRAVALIGARRADRRQVGSRPQGADVDAPFDRQTDADVSVLVNDSWTLAAPLRANERGRLLTRGGR